MNCPQSLKWVGAIAAIAGAAMFISMYPDLKRYIKLERM